MPPTCEQELDNLRDNKLSVHPNGKIVKRGLKRPLRNDAVLFEELTFPDEHLGDLLRGIIFVFLAKQEHRIGWARKSATDDTSIWPHPNESVAAHQWGVAMLVKILSLSPKFQEELPNFDRIKALEMALMHDVAEVVTGDITPVDGISPETKHKLESEAMIQILSCFPSTVAKSLQKVYNHYEERNCIESKFVKDCDRLDFLIQAFILERQGFSGFSEFYDNVSRSGFSTTIVHDLVNNLKQARQELSAKGKLYIEAIRSNTV